MKRWKGTVEVSYLQVIEVEAETQVEAEATMLDWFDPNNGSTELNWRQVSNVQALGDEAE
jgi:hypothetical protein